jgi:hypothetical protein
VSTQINVTVGSGGLSDKARQLQTVARQAQLEKERQQRIEAQGQEQRTAKLEAEGKALDGSSLYAPGFKQPEVERRPAANRLTGAEKWLMPLLERPSIVQVSQPSSFDPATGIFTPSILTEVYDTPVKVLKPASEQSLDYVARISYNVTSITPAVQTDLLLYEGTGGSLGPGQPIAGTPANIDGIGPQFALTAVLAKFAPNTFPSTAGSRLKTKTDSATFEIDVASSSSNFRSLSVGLALGIFGNTGLEYGNRYDASFQTSTTLEGSQITVSVGKINAQQVQTILFSFNLTGTEFEYAPNNNAKTRYALVLEKDKISVYRDGVRIVTGSLSEVIQKDSYEARVTTSVSATVQGPDEGLGPTTRNVQQFIGPARFDSTARYKGDAYSVAPIT